MLSIHTQAVFYARKFFKIFLSSCHSEGLQKQMPFVALLLSRGGTATPLYHVSTRRDHFSFSVCCSLTYDFFFSGYRLTANEVTNSCHKTETNSFSHAHNALVWVPLYQVSATAACSCDGVERYFIHRLINWICSVFFLIRLYHLDFAWAFWGVSKERRPVYFLYFYRGLSLSAGELTLRTS